MTKKELREYEELTNNKKITCVYAVFLIVYILITSFAATHYIASLIKDKTNNELIDTEYEEHEVFASYYVGILKKYDYTVIIKIEHDEYITFKTTDFIPKGSIAVIQFEEYSNGDTYASIIGVECKRILIEEGGN